MEERAAAAAALEREREVLGADWRRVVEAGRASEKARCFLVRARVSLTLALALSLSLTLALALTPRLGGPRRR